MCGIAGLWQFGGGAEDDLRARAAHMSGALQHRGPDDDGLWTDAAAGGPRARRRAGPWPAAAGGSAPASRPPSVTAPSPAGAQPMRSASGRYAIVFNGEI